MRTTTRWFATGAMLLFALMLVSCPQPITTTMVTSLHDEIPPTLEVLSPADDSYCANIVEVTGLVSDLAGNGDLDGEVAGITFEVSGTSVSGGASIAPDGSFSFQFSTTSLGTNFTLTIIATDWNGNAQSKLIPLRRRANDGVPSLTATPANKSIRVEWDDVPQTESYTLYFTTNGSLPSGSNGQTRPNAEYPDPITSPLDLPGLENGQMHVFQLRANPASGWPESVSDYVQAIPLSEHTLDVRVSSEYGQLRIQWDDIAATDTYEVLKSTSFGGPFFNVSGPVTGTSFVDTSLIQDQWYFYKVRPDLAGSVESGPYGSKIAPFRTEFPAFTGYVDTPNQAVDVAVDGEIAYVADKRGGIQIVDISRPQVPVVVGSYDLGDTYVYDVDGANGYVYFEYDNDLVVLNATNPSSPTVESTLPLGTGADGVHLEGNRLYLACGSSGVFVVDVSNPASPSFIDDPLTTTGAKDVEVHGDYAYVLAGADLKIFDVTNLALPNDPIGTYPTPGINHRLQVEGDYAYIADGFSGLTIVDVINPASPGATYAGSHPTADLCLGVAVRGGFAYASAFEDGIEVYDVSDPTSAQYVTTAPFPLTLAQAYGLALVGDYLYATAYTWGLHLWNVANPRSPTPTGSGGAFNSDAIAVSGDYAFLAGWNAGVRVMDVSDRENPVQVASYPSSEHCIGLDVRGNHLFIAQDGPWGHVQILDVSDPTQLVELGSAQLEYDAYEVEVHGDYAYAAAELGGLAVVDISDPEAPFLAKMVKANGLGQGVTVRGNYAYLADAWEGLAIYDITIPEAPMVVGNVVTNASPDAYRVAVKGDYAYVTDSGEMNVVDISDPRNPVLAENGSAVPVVRTYSGNGTEVEIIGDFLYLAADNSGLQIYDASGDPGTVNGAAQEYPILIGAFDETGVHPSDVVVFGSYAYISDTDPDGIRIVDLYPE